jgi:hypothetical protein
MNKMLAIRSRNDTAAQGDLEVGLLAVAEGLASGSRQLGCLSLEPSLSTMLGAQAAGEGLVCFESAKILDAGRERQAFEEVSGSMFVAGFRAIECVALVARLI